MNVDFSSMEMKARMFAELDAFDVLLRKLSEISRRNDAERRMDLVNLRRELSLRIGTIGATAQSLFELEPSHPSENEFRQRLSSVRYAVAMHQATWPAVAINEADSDFSRSASSVREGILAFLKWCRDTFR